MTGFTAIGELLWDCFERNRYLGGAPFNFTANVHNMGLDTHILSRVGNDPEGTEILDQLERRGISVEYIQIDSSKSTGESIVTLNSQKIPVFDCRQDVAYDAIAFEAEEVWDIYENSTLIYVGTLAQRHLISRTTIQRILAEAPDRIQIVYDLNLRGWDGDTSQIIKTTLEYTHILKLSGDELREVMTRIYPQKVDWDLSDQLTFLHEEYGLELVALTLGEQGAVLSQLGQNPIYSPGFRAKVLDTTGAGDAFCAALCVGYLQELELEEIGLLANAVGGFVAIHNGATPDYTLKQIQEFINAHARIEI